MKTGLSEKQVIRILKQNLEVFNKEYKNNLNITNRKEPKMEYYGFVFTVYLDDGRISCHQHAKQLYSKNGMLDEYTGTKIKITL